jgi:phosphopantetheine adenylyltransferase
MDINELLEPNAKKAVFTFGRFNPPTKGHARLMDVVKNASSGADHYVFTGKTNDPKKNPLQYKDKITFLRAMFPHMNIMDDPAIRTPWEALEELGKQYNEVIMVVGSDRKQDFESQMRPYLKDFGIEKFSIVSSGERDADATDVSGVSASKARALAKAGDFNTFSQTIDGGEKLKQQLYTKVRQGMGIMEMANKPKMPKKPDIKSRDPNWKDMEAIRKSGAAGSHKDKKALDKRGYTKHKSKSYDINESAKLEAPESKPIAYVDMDGVLANFFAEYAKLAGVTTGNYKDIPPAKTDPTLDKMIGTDFFNRLPKFPTTDKLIQMIVKEFGSYKILSSPLRGDHENSKVQKIKWIKRELAIQPDEIIVVGRKDSYAVQSDGTQNILIDDRGRNIQGWLQRGGYGVKYQADEDPLSKVQNSIKDFKEKNNLTEHGGRVVKGINTTHDVGVDAIKKQSAKFGFKVTKDGVPPIMTPKNLRRVKRMQEALIKINGSNKDLTLQQQMDLQGIKKSINHLVKEAKKTISNPAEVPYQNDGGEMSLLTHPGTEMHQKMKATSKPGTEDWFKTWRTLSYLTKGRKNHYMLPVKEQLEKLLIKHGMIKEDEVDPDTLKKQIITRIQKTDNPKLLNKVASILRSGNIGNIVKFAFGKDSDAKQFINRLSQIIVDMEVPIPTKIQFLKEFGRQNYIKPEILFDGSGDVKSMDDWWTGSGIASVMFQKMINDPQLQGKFAGEAGPGEVALAAFHRKITVGTSPDAGYDLKWGGKLIEVKAKASTSSGGGGRWTAYDDTPLETYLNRPDSLLNKELVPAGVRTLPGKTTRVKQPHLAQVLSDPQYAKDPNNPLTSEQQKQIFKLVLKTAYQSADDGLIDSAVVNYPNVSPLQLGKIAFQSYKVKQGLHSMLLVRLSSDGVQTISIDEPTEALMQFVTIGDTYVRGQKQRGMAYQVAIK